MASRRSHAALDSKLIEYELWGPRRGTDASRMSKRIRDAAFFFNHYACYLCSNIIKTSKLC